MLNEGLIQPYLDRRRPGTSKFVTQRQEYDEVEILSGVLEAKTTGTPIGLLIRNKDQRPKDYGEIAKQFRPGHADYTYFEKYGIRDYRGGGRSSARETAVRVAAGAIAKSLKCRRLLLMTNVEGVLDKDNKLIEEISSSKILEMIKDNTITEGMIPKINTCLDAVKNGVTAVGIIDGRKQHSILFEIFSDKGSGTLIRK